MLTLKPFRLKLPIAFTICTALLFCSMTNLAHAQKEPFKFVPFKAFLQRVKDARASDFSSPPSSKVENAASFEEMRRYVLSLYGGIHVSHSYVIGSQIVDCVPIDQQPSLRGQGKQKIAPQPPDYGSVPAPLPQQAPNATDPFGNIVGCGPETIPMRRITLEQLSQFRTLHDFLKKAPG